MSVHAIHESQSKASLYSSTSDWGAEHTLETGIKLPPGTPTYKVAVLDLHPTQLAVGMQQVHAKMSKVANKQQKGPQALEKFLQGHPVPVVLGPGQQRYMIDHHHLCCALHKMGVKSCYAGTVCDYSELSQEQFWVAMARRNCLWPFRSDGSAADVHMLPGLLPQTVEGLADDPYRSLAALVRKAGGYNKSNKPFSEFIWANHLRPRVPMVLMAVPDVERYVHHGISHAMHPDAAALPGYTALHVASKQQLDSMSCLGQEQLQAVE
ncbi:ParB/Sulfiredoxin [Scenedesmus sp. NREL 46B-D3]|nr:ParB/Sulfiredoxin [Scenedesmus sp. NREL 46B-D3]